jgi:hypothetical protein
MFSFAYKVYYDANCPFGEIRPPSHGIRVLHKNLLRRREPSTSNDATSFFPRIQGLRTFKVRIFALQQEVLEWNKQYDVILTHP